MRRATIFLAIALVFGSATLFLRSALAQSAPSGQTGGAPPAAVKTVGETYKNIQVLTEFKNAPANDLFVAMQFMSGSLSVSCNYCHVAQTGPFDSDANKTKLKAREMIKMMRAINEANFGGHQEVTCNTCHRGSPRPNGTPSPWYKSSEDVAAYLKVRPVAVPSSLPASGSPSATPAETAPVLPDVDQVLAKYRKAVGAEKLKSIRLSGTSGAALGSPAPFEITAVFPDKFLITTTNRGIETKAILNAGHGWRVTPQGSAPLPANAWEGFMGRMGPVLFPVKYEQSSAPRKVTAVEKIGDKTYYVVESHTAKELEQLFFDAQSGLLFKAHREVGTWFGTRVEETTFEDYRDLNGLKFAYVVTYHFMEDQQVFKISAIQANLDVDPTKFEPPPPKTP